VFKSKNKKREARNEGRGSVDDGEYVHQAICERDLRCGSRVLEEADEPKRTTAAIVRVNDEQSKKHGEQRRLQRRTGRVRGKPRRSEPEKEGPRVGLSSTPVCWVLKHVCLPTLFTPVVFV
jgi:hypothetical protein